MKKAGIYLLILTLLFSLNPMPSYVHAGDLEESEVEVVLFSEEIGGDIPLYEEIDQIGDSGAEFMISDESDALLLHTEPEVEIGEVHYSYIQYIYIDEEEKEQRLEGYVETTTVVPFEMAEQYSVDRAQDNEEASKDSNQIESDADESVELEVDTPSEENKQNIDVSTEEEEETGSETQSDEEGDEEPVKEEETKNEDNGGESRILSTFSLKAKSVVEKKTSKLARVKNRNVKIFEEIEGKSFSAGPEHTDAVYYVKRQAELGSETYYLISTEPSATKGVVGWVNSKDLSYHPHISIDKQKKTLYIKGNGNARAKAWGAKKDIMYADLSKYAGEVFQVHLTEGVGNNTWYRGKLNGKTVWLHESYVTQAKESKTSKLARIKNGNVSIYEKIEGKSFKAGSEYTDAVYYVKKQAELGSKTYYLISNEPSTTKGIVGWVNSKDLSYHPHTSIDKQTKTLYIKGNGNARAKAWGAKKDIVYADLSKYAGETFQVHLTESVGNNTWYRGKLNGKTVWLHESYVTQAKESKTSKLARIKNRDVKIYEELEGKSFSAGPEHTDAVYYVKKQAELGSETYYLISTEPSATKGVVGWVNTKDLSYHPHTSIDKQTKTLYIKGNGNARAKAWGAKKDIVYANLSKYAGETFQVHLTEGVGNNTWYRGKLNGKTVWLHESYVTQAKESKTSKLARIKNGNVSIYEKIEGKSFKAGSEYTDAVYYVKKQAELGSETYYLISTEPSATKGVVGWVNTKDLSYHPHISIDKQTKTLYIKGNGNARAKAWGAKKDIMYADLSKYAGEVFQVHLTEGVGNNTWYRGKLNGKTVWLHESYVTQAKESKTSKLARIKNRNVKIYEELEGKTFSAGLEYTDAVYYIKKQAELGSEIYFLISNEPSATKGVVGWVNSKDLSYHSHISIDKQTKTFYIKGNGNARAKAWGAKKDIVYADLSKYAGETFQVHLTEGVGNNTWYRGKLNGKTVWLHESYLSQEGISFYNLTLTEALKIQSQQLQMIMKNGKTVNASKDEIKKYLDPKKYINDPRQRFQFLILSKPSGASRSYLEDQLRGKIYEKGSLYDQGKAFYDAGQKYQINDLYLIAHARLETGNGKSPLSNGVKVGINANNELELVDNKNETKLKKIKEVYNLFGISAVDSNALAGGAKYAYVHGWTSPAEAIHGGARWINEQYTRNSYKQNTLYKMKWNPDMAETEKNAWKQYASDVEWASKIANITYNLYEGAEYTNSSTFDYPVYK